MTWFELFAKWIGPVGGVVAILVAFFSAYISIRKINNEKRKRDVEAKKKEAESASIISESAIALIRPLKEEVHMLKTDLENTERELKQLEREVESLTARNKRCREAIHRLVHQLKSLGHVPVCLPDDFDDDEVPN